MSFVRVDDFAQILIFYTRNSQLTAQNGIKKEKRKRFIVVVSRRQMFKLFVRVQMCEWRRVASRQPIGVRTYIEW